jgi:hypothetical protein
MSKKVADVLWEMLAKAGVKRCYGIVGDALNPVVDALRRNGAIEFVLVRHEEYGVFAAVAEAYFTGNPVVVCGTAGAWSCPFVQRIDGRPERKSPHYRHRRGCRVEHYSYVCARGTEPVQVFRGGFSLYRTAG